VSRAGWRAGVGGFVGAAFWKGGVVRLGEEAGLGSVEREDRFWNCGLVGTV
jgi:hypothetical protein